MSNDEQKKGKLGAPQLSDMILGSLKPRVGKETTKWVAGLADEAMEAAEEAARMQGVEMLTSASQVPPKPAQVGTVPFMDYLFDCFQQYEFEFNRAETEQHLHVEIERPAMVMETMRAKLKAPETKQVFRGRLSTRYWTLLLRGHQDSIDGWILPIDQLISFASDQEPYTQFLDMRARLAGNDIIWTVDGVEVTWDKVRSFAKQLFAALIHVAKTDANDGLVFSLKGKKVSKKTAAPPSIAEQPSYDFNEHNPEFEGFSSAQTLPPTKSKQIAEEIRPQPRPVSTTGSAAAASIDENIEALVRVFSDELEKLSAAGQAAFAKQDMAMVEKIFQRTNRVKQLRDEVSAQTKAWKAALKQALES